MTTKDRTKFYCSFCGKMQDEVEKLIAGPTVFICNECVGLCQDMINEARWEKWFHKQLKEKGFHVVPLPPNNSVSSLDKFNAFHRS